MTCTAADRRPEFACSVLPTGAVDPLFVVPCVSFDPKLVTSPPEGRRRRFGEVLDVQGVGVGVGGQPEEHTIKLRSDSDGSRKQGVCYCYLARHTSRESLVDSTLFANSVMVYNLATASGRQRWRRLCQVFERCRCAHNF